MNDLYDPAILTAARKRQRLSRWRRFKFWLGDAIGTVLLWALMVALIVVGGLIILAFAGSIFLGIVIAIPVAVVAYIRIA